MGSLNVNYKPLDDRDKILLPPLHIKLGLIKQFIRGLGKDSPRLQYLQKLFHNSSYARITVGVFNGPQNRELVKHYDEFLKILKPLERKAWQSFVDDCNGFLGNNRAPNYKNLINNLITNYGKMGCRMSLKLHVGRSPFGI